MSLFDLQCTNQRITKHYFVQGTYVNSSKKSLHRRYTRLRSACSPSNPQPLSPRSRSLAHVGKDGLGDVERGAGARGARRRRAHLL